MTSFQPFHPYIRRKETQCLRIRYDCPFLLMEGIT